MKTLIRKLTPKTTWCKINFVMTIVMLLGFAALPFVKSYMSVVLACPQSSYDGEVILLPDPDDCGSYFECHNGIAVPKECPDGLLYCSELQYCTWEGHPDCRFDCLTGGNKKRYVEIRTEDTCFKFVVLGQAVYGTAWICKENAVGSTTCSTCR